MTPARQIAITFHNQAQSVVGHDLHLAYRLLCSAVTVDPTMGMGWVSLSNALADMKHYPAAIACLERALALSIGDGPGDMTPALVVKATVNLGHWMLNDGLINDALVVSIRAKFLAEDAGAPAFDKAFCRVNAGLAWSVFGKVKGALSEIQEAFAIDQSPIIETALAFALLFEGQYAAGLKHFEARFPYKLPRYLEYPYPRWDGTKVKSLFVAPDQGMGDTLSFIRFVVMAAERAAWITMHVQPELVRLLRGVLPPNVGVTAVTPDFPPADAWCPIMSLPVALGLTDAEIRDAPRGFGVVRETIRTDWKSPAARLHVGIAYGGSKANDIDRWRSVPVEHFLRLASVPGVQLYSLQVGPRVEELHAAGAAGLIRDMSQYIRDAQDAANIMRELDLVITVESFVGHLAGAVDVPAWVAVSSRGGDWRCGRHGDKPLWYDKTRLWRQDQTMEWVPVFEAMRGELRNAE
jgi:tetratricopeptide (TPR) repeat protein